MNNRLIKSNNAGGGGGCIDTVDLYNPFPDGGGVASYQLNGDATDESGNYDGTATNVTYGAGQFGQAGVFNGTSSFIEYPLKGGFLNTRTTVSVSLWFKCSALADAGILFTDYASGSMNAQFYIATNGKYSGTTRYNSNDLNIPESTNSYNDNQWHNVVVIINQGDNTRKDYIDGALINSGTLPTGSWTGSVSQKITSGTIFNTDTSGYQYYFNGSIDQVRIFNRALRPYEVEALYTEQYCTPTIVPSEHFNTVLYTGNSSTNAITGVGFQPDFSWIKGRNQAGSWHVLTDSVRGVNSQLYSNETNAEATFTTQLTSFNTAGFTLGNRSDSNGSGFNYVAWNFKAGGAAVSNTDGTITSQVSANVEAGFSIVSYTGNGTASETVGHGLGAAPSIYIVKRRNSTSNWAVFTTILGSSPTPTKYLFLNTTAAIANSSQASPTSTVLNVLDSFDNINSATYIAYCFAEVEGFSSFGSYVGTGASGNSIVTGFEPAFVMIKRTDAVDSWYMVDNKRLDNSLFADLSQAEVSVDQLDFVENGFVLKQSTGWGNSNGGSFIYMAFSADPTTVEPTLADSFNTVLYTGTGSGSKSVTGVGFQPDLVWGKARTDAISHILFDSVRGENKQLTSNTTAAEVIRTSDAYLFDPDGFTVTTAGNLNNAVDYVAWNWKGAEIPAINSNGSIKSVVSANPAAGFSIVSYTANAVSGATVGHGLNKELDFLIVKSTNLTEAWSVYVKDITDTDAKYLRLNEANGIYTTTFPRFIVGNFNSNVFSVGNNNSTNGILGTDKYIAYCFAEVAGFSKFGSYTGNGSTSGPTITTGFEPAFVMFKITNGGGNWLIKDNKRGDLASLYPNIPDAEYTTYDEVAFLADGFQLKSTDGSSNGNGFNYIYMAFANQF
jgi:hypothetical protein